MRVSFFDYDESHLEEGSVDDIAKCLEATVRGATSWINVDGVHDSTKVEALGQHFGLHPLVLEDIVTPAQRSKVEQYGESTYIVVRTLRFDAERQLDKQRADVARHRRAHVDFQELPDDVFDSVRARIRTRRPQSRRASSTGRRARHYTAFTN